MSQLAVGHDINLLVTAIASECINLIDVIYQPKFPIIRAYISFIYLFVRWFYFFMIQAQCDVCGRWFHVACLPVATKTVQMKECSFSCEPCLHI